MSLCTLECNKVTWAVIFLSTTYSWSGLQGCLERSCTYSSFPRKDVSLHTSTLFCIPEDTLMEGKLCGSPSSSQPLGAASGVKTWSELTDARSVLRSNDVHDESEETEGLMSSFSSCHLSPWSMVREWQATRTWGEKNDGENIWARWKSRMLSDSFSVCLCGSMMPWRVREEAEKPGTRRRKLDHSGTEVDFRLRQVEICRREMESNTRKGGFRWKVRAAALNRWWLTSNYIPFPPQQLNNAKSR